MNMEVLVLRMINELSTNSPDLVDLGLHEALALTSYILDERSISTKEAFIHYLEMTEVINKLLNQYYNPKVVVHPLFKPGGMLTLKDESGEFHLSDRFHKARELHKSTILKQFPNISSILEGLQYPKNSSQ